MKKLIFLTFILSFSAFAENSRSPAVLDGTCDTNVPTTVTSIVNNREVVSERSVADILKDQCLAVKKCMFSANEEDMDELKSLEAIACNNNMSAVTTRTPGMVIDKNFDGKRKSKFDSHDQLPIIPPTVTPSVISK